MKVKLVAVAAMAALVAGMHGNNSLEGVDVHPYLSVLAEEDLNYFLTRSIGNHHMIVSGDYEALVHEFYKWL